ncbi:PGM2L synthase, partial [Tricholaema leucomelas]|nr:PGM2L synthase [Tricholaema leucomelas]
MGECGAAAAASEVPLAASTGDAELDKAVRQWLSWDKNERTRGQIEELLRSGQVQELRARLCQRLSFGTAGLRAPMGAGFSRINDLTIIQATQGTYRYLERRCPGLRLRGFVIGYDTRGQEASNCSSHRLAQLAAAVLLAKEVPVYLFSTYVPTPFVPYAVVQLGAAAGAMITASHNRKEDNGYKLYWAGGAQLPRAQEQEVLSCMEQSLEPWAGSWDLQLAESSSLRRDPLGAVCASYLRDLTKLCAHRELNQRCQLRFVHSSFHGVGHHYVQEAFRAFGFVPPIPVPEQQCPDPNFSTLSCPNPEEGEAVLELSLRLAEQEGARVVLATDPDADRLAVAERQQDASWKVFSGNELAALFGWWLFSCWQQRAPPGASPANLYMLATTVSSKILRAIAQQEGFHFEETLPGFKWVGNRAQELLGMGMEVLFAFEESIGFMCGTSVLDKDGVSAAVVLAEMASFLHAQGLSLAQKLSQIYDRYGYHLSRTCYFLCQPGTAEGIFERLRNFGCPGRYPGHCADFAILHLRDLARGYDSSQPGGKAALPGGSQLLTFTFGNGAEASLRRSGTEPKLKLYAELCARP